MKSKLKNGMYVLAPTWQRGDPTTGEGYEKPHLYLFPIDHTETYDPSRYRKFSDTSLDVTPEISQEIFKLTGMKLDCSTSDGITPKSVTEAFNFISDEPISQQTATHLSDFFNTPSPETYKKDGSVERCYNDRLDNGVYISADSEAVSYRPFTRFKKSMNNSQFWSLPDGVEETAENGVDSVEKLGDAVKHFSLSNFCQSAREKLSAEYLKDKFGIDISEAKKSIASLVEMGKQSLQSTYEKTKEFTASVTDVAKNVISSVKDTIMER